MKSIEFQLFFISIQYRLLALPTAFFTLLLIFKFNNYEKIILICLGIQVLILLYMRYKFNLRKRGIKNVLFSDKPYPSIVDIIKMAGLPFLLIILFTLGWSGVVIVLQLWGVASLTGLFLGIILYGLWLYEYRIFCAFNTLYTITDNGIWIYYGLDEIFIPYKKIFEINYSKTIQTDLTKILKGSQTYIPGVRNHDFLLFRIKTGSYIINLWFPEIHITPTNPQHFLNILEKYL